MAKRQEPPPPDELEPEAPVSLFPRPFVEGYEHINPDTYNFNNCWTRTHRTEPYNQDDVIAAILATGGNFAEMSMLLGRNRQRVKDYVFSHPEIRDVLVDFEEACLDMVGKVGMRAALAGDLPQVRFIQSTLGKDRGFTTRVEATGKNGSPLSVADIDFSDPVKGSEAYQQMVKASSKR